MATDRSLATLLRALQSHPTSLEDASRLLTTAASLLALLTNPLNIALLTTQLLTAPAIWAFPTPSLHIPLQVLTAVHTATWRVVTGQHGRNASRPSQGAITALEPEKWARAVIAGANEKCEQWKHSLVLGGILLGLEQQGSAPPQLRKLRQEAALGVVDATNLALNDAATEAGGDLAEHSICLALGHCFDLLDDFDKSSIHTTKLLPLLPRAMYFSRDGLHSGYFLGMADADVLQRSRDKFEWSADSASFREVQRVASGPIVSALGSLSRLAVFSVGRARDLQLLVQLSHSLAAFTRSLCVQWRQNKLSEVAESEEFQFLGDKTLRTTLPLLWQILKAAMFSTVAVQAALMSQVLGSMFLLQGQASSLAAQALNSLRNLYFIISRVGHDSLSQFTFIYVSSIDVLSRDPRSAETFLQQIRPTEFGRISRHPHERCFDLFYLNAAEQFALCLGPLAGEELLSAATPYLVVGGDTRLLEIFEAAHSVALAVFSAPQNSALVSKHLPFYLEALFQTFPRSLSARQFRLAIRTLVRLTCTPSPIAVTDPFLASTILELVRSRSLVAVTSSLQDDGRASSGAAATEQAALVLALLDCLPLMPPALLREWLPLAAEAVEHVLGNDALEVCRAHFWDVLSGDAMASEKGETAMFWWSTEGGRSRIFDSAPQEGAGVLEPTMSGALDESNGA